MSNSHELEFCHELRVYVFRGRELAPPPAGTYDASKWTPPTHQLFRVSIWNDGMFRVELNGVEIATGDNASRCKSGARDILMKIAAK